MNGLRQLVARPIAEHERARVFAAVAALLLLVAVVLPLVAPHDGPAPSPSPTTTGTSLPVPTPAPATPSAPAVAATPPPAVVMRAGRRFVTDYLAYLYGHTRGRTFDGASASLRRRLASRPPRVSPAMRRRRPRVADLTGHRLASRSRWVLTATIADGGPARYPVELVIERRASGVPVVVQLGGD